jgi:hypothetical protein
MKLQAVLTSSLAALLLCSPAWGGGGRGGRETKSIRNETGSKGPPHPDVDPPDEEADTTYRFVGLRVRYIVIPQFYMSLFGSGGTTVGVPAVGPEFAIRKNGFEYVLSAMYASYAMDATPFKAKSDGNDAWELVDSNIKALYLMSDFLWSAEINPRYAIVYGGGVGLAAVFGDIHRVQAYPGSGGENDPSTYLPCVGPGNPNATFCGTDNAHYGNYTEPSWANGGSKPIVFPWLSVQTGLRFKPFRQFMLRLDVGWNLLNGPFFGLAGDYGL